MYIKTVAVLRNTSCIENSDTLKMKVSYKRDAIDYF